MQPYFEIKYLELKWYDQETLTKITESLGALRLDYDSARDLFQTETSIYSRLEGIERGQLAIRYLNKSSSAPYIQKSNGEYLYFSQITDPDTNKSWWILKEKWDAVQKQWLGVAPNIAGTLRLVVQSKICEINISGFDFSREELDQYLQAFKNDLWELILDEDSSVQGEAKQTQGMGVNEDVIECIKNLVASASKIQLNPKVELREVQALKLRKHVKPVNRTFMEMATKTNQRYLTSRAATPSYDVPENRYILFALERCYRIINQVVILAQNKSQRYQTTIQKIQDQYDSFTDTVKVNRNLVVADLKKIRLRTRLEYWQKQLQKKLNESAVRLTSLPCSSDLVIKITGHTKNRYTKETDGFFVLVKIGDDWVKPNSKSGIVKPIGNLSELIQVLERGMELKINCNYSWRETPGAVLFNFDSIHSIELLNCTALEKAKDVFTKERAIGIELSQNNWTKRLSSREIEEQEKEKASLRNRVQFYIENQKTASYVYEQVEPKLRALKSIIKHFRVLGVKPSSQFPNSMTFVQNPNYQGVHNNYKVLRDITSLDDDLLLSLEQIDEIGLVNMPLLYERWVFIQLLLVLKESFRFTPQADWKYKIINCMKENEDDIEIKLVNQNARRYLSLWYEKTLPNNRRPDFILDLTWYSNKQENPSQNTQRFVLDAKFYDKSTFERSGGMLAKIDELYVDKNYSEEQKNPVFLIHPCRTLIDEQKTAQDWGKYNFLGEIDILDDESYFSHNKGAVLLNPINREQYNDELQRLFGLFLQYKLEASTLGESDTDITDAVPICIRCGSTDIKKIEKSSGYYNRLGQWVERTSRSVWMQCQECEQIQSYNHCANTSCNTRLIKNGFYWSYHSARALEPYNMKCPACGEWGGW